MAEDWKPKGSSFGYLRPQIENLSLTFFVLKQKMTWHLTEKSPSKMNWTYLFAPHPLPLLYSDIKKEENVENPDVANHELTVSQLSFLIVNTFR